jgi:hypothetical protein
VVDANPSWMDRIKSIGNSVNPKQVYPILKTISYIEQMI